jgi:hypothetical protein
MGRMAARSPIRVYLEIGKTKVFACALDWPGWCRARQSPEQALDALAEYASRYAAVPKLAGIAFPAGLGAEPFAVVQRIPGSANTDFGTLGAAAEADHEPSSAAQARRQVALVRAAWSVFDEVAAGSPAELRKGPRGGGRDRDKMIDHVLAAEAMYARKLGIKHPVPQLGDAAAIESLRASIGQVLGKSGSGAPAAERGWPTRYAARRIAWHVLDHAWEMQDRVIRSGDPVG